MIEQDQEVSDQRKEVFVFCWYPDQWLPRAIIVDWSKMSASMKEQIDQMIIQCGSLIQKNYTIKKEGKLTSETLNGYTNISENKFIESNDDLDGLISAWEYHSDNLHSYFAFGDHEAPENEWMNHASEYYINDQYSNYEPMKLHQILSAMTELPQQKQTNDNNEKTIFNSKFTVKHCILISDVPVLDDENKDDDNSGIKMHPVRFFYKFLDSDQIDDAVTSTSTVLNYDDQLSESVNDILIKKLEPAQELVLTATMEEGIIQMIKTSLGVSDVVLAESTYGFLKPLNLSQYDSFVNASFVLKFNGKLNSLYLFFM